MFRPEVKTKIRAHVLYKPSKKADKRCATFPINKLKGTVEYTMFKAAIAKLVEI